MLSTPTAPGTPPVSSLGKAVEAGLTAAGQALDRLFAPRRVRLELVDDWQGRLAPIATDPVLTHVGVAFDVEGPVCARLAVLAEDGENARLAAALLRQPWRPGDAIDQSGRAAFAEMANIVASSFLNGMAREIGLRLVPSVPMLEESPLRQVIGDIAAARGWAFGARFTIELPEGATTGLFVGSPEILPAER